MHLDVETREVGDSLTFRHETIHHPLYELNLVLNREIDEIRVD